MAKEREQLAEAVLNHALEIICLLTVEDFIVVKRPSDGNRCTFSIHATEITSTDYHSGGPQLLFTLQGVEEKTQKMVALLANKIVSLMSRKVLTECESADVYSSDSYKNKWNDLKAHGKQNKEEPAICNIEPPPAPVQRSAEKSYPMKFSIKEEPCEQPLHTSGGISALPSPSLIPGASEPNPHLPPVNVYVPFMGPQPSPGLILLSPCDLKPTTDGGSSANTFTSLGAQKLKATVHQSTEKSHPTKHFIKEEPEEPHRSTDETLAFPPPKFVLESPKSKPPLPATELHIPAQTAPGSGIIYAHEIKYDPDEDSETTIDSMDTDTPQSPSSDQEDEYTIIYQIKEDQEESKDSSTSSFEDNFSPADVTNTDEEYVPPEPTRKKPKSRKSRSEMPPPCEVCGKVLCSKSTLEKHLQIHTGDRPFICTECGQRFSCKNHLTTHERSHTGERPFVCNVCGRKFFKQQHLVLHKVTHTGEKPYTCPVCGKGFTRQSSVVKHSGMHAEQKPFVCNVCGKSYCQYASLVVHQRIHSGEKPFVCQVCEKAFTCKATMLKHEKSHLLKSPLPHMPQF